VPCGGIARCASRVPALQKTQSPKHVTSAEYSGSRALFVHAPARIWLYRGRQSTEWPQIGARSPGQTCSRFVTKNFRIPIFIIPRNFSEKVISSPKCVFLTFRGTFAPQGGPTGTWEYSHSIRHRIPDISMCSVVT